MNERRVAMKDVAVLRVDEARLEPPAAFPTPLVRVSAGR